MENEGEFFTPENRARLYQLLLRLLPPPKREPMGGVIGGEELYELQDALKFQLGKLTLGAGDSIAENMKDFVMTASENDLYALIELMPQAQFKANQKALLEGRFPLGPPDTKSAVRRIIETLNLFLEKYGSQARFRSDGTLDREGSTVDEPRKLLELPGRDALVRDLVPLLQRERPVGIIFLDLDSFKAVNEKFGHKAGDDCLERSVSVIYGVIGGKGKLYRYGKHAGDEFVAVLPNFDTSETGATGARLREAIQSASLGGEVGITASIGVASSDRPDLDLPERLVEAADEAAGISKHTGKNRVTIWPPTAEARKASDESRNKTPI